jgi:hypothetical protein
LAAPAPDAPVAFLPPLAILLLEEVFLFDDLWFLALFKVAFLCPIFFFDCLFFWVCTEPATLVATAAPAFLPAFPLPEALFPPFAFDLDFLFEPDLAALDDLLTPFFFPFF